MRMWHGRVLAVLVLAALAASPVAGLGSAEETRRELPGLRHLRLASGSVNVEIVRSDGTPRLEASLDRRRELVVTGSGPEVRVDLGRIRVFLGYVPRESLRLFLAPGTRVEIVSGSGEVSIRDLPMEGLTLESGSGDVLVTDSPADMVIRSGSGEITVTGSDGTKQLRTSSGDIEVSRSVGDMILESGSGEIDLETVRGAISATSSSGTITGTAVTLTGATSFTTESGNTRVELTNREGDLRLDLDAGSGSVRAGESSGDRLLLGSGPIELVGRSRSGNQVYSFQ